jgi:outer membrane scaffolding protein for murein synthesis (MipA/OmpV family)
MAEEQEESTGKSFKGILIGLVSTITLGVGGFITNKLTGGDKEEAAPIQQAAPVINITTNQTQQQAAGGNKTIIINKGADGKPIQPVVKPKKKEGDEFKEEAPKW